VILGNIFKGIGVNSTDRDTINEYIDKAVAIIGGNGESLIGTGLNDDVT
jgi:hypothetical protein